MKEKLDALYDELFCFLKILIDKGTTPEIVPEVARVLIDLITLQSQM